MKSGKLVRRYEHHYFFGWVVTVKRRGRRWVKYFNDKPAGRRAALRQACQHRQQLLTKLPPPVRIKQTYVLNKTGEIGVALVEERTRAGRRFLRYVASWPTMTGGRMKASFSVGCYGKTAAKQMAIQARRHGVAELYAAWRGRRGRK